jgi:dolichol-phosphate mannosyltransferase
VQTAIVTPLVLGLFGVTVWHGAKKLAARDGDDRWNFALSFSLPLFCLFVVSSLKTEVHVNWTAPAFLSLLPGAVQVFLTAVETAASPPRAKWQRIGAWTSLGFCIAAVLVGLTSLAWGFPPLYAQAGGWRGIAAAVESTEQSLANKSGRDPFVLDTGKYDLAAEVGFYSREPDEQVNNYALGKRGLGFRYWTDLNSFKGAPAVALMEETDHGVVRELRERFDEVGTPVMLTANGPGWHRRSIYLVECVGYHGPTEADVRPKPRLR